MAINPDEQTENRTPVAESKVNWTKFLMEFLSIFFAVILAFALNSWNDTRKTRNAETNILKEISNGLEADLKDAELNAFGHKFGLKAVVYFRSLINGEPVNKDSLGYYKGILNRDFISIQNSSGYESLKSQGLDVIQSDELRLQIIGLYEYSYSIIKKFEEEYAAAQFFLLYEDRFNEVLSPYVLFGADNKITSIKVPLNLSRADRNRLLIDLRSIEINRRFILSFYEELEVEIQQTKRLIDEELANR